MKNLYFLLALAGLIAFPAQAENKGLSDKQSQVLKKLLATYAEKATEEGLKRGKLDPNPTFSAEIGRAFYLKRRTWQTSDFTCSGCHTENPAKEGKHIESGKSIKPLAPAANHERFTDAAKVEKNFSQHCLDLHERDCFAREKGDFIAYLMSVR